jgi:hypothetical protein
MIFVNVADLPLNDGTGRTWREANLERQHTIPVGTLVELVFDPEEDPDLYENYHGVRLWVWRHTRDCDGSPLYTLSMKRNIDVSSQWDVRLIEGGWSDGCMRVMESPKLEE